MWASSKTPTGASAAMVTSASDRVALTGDLRGLERADLHPARHSRRHAATGRRVEHEPEGVGLAARSVAGSHRANAKLLHARAVGVVDDRAPAAAPEHVVVTRLGNAGIATDDIGEPAGSDMVVVAAGGIGVAIADVECSIALQISGHHAGLLVGAVHGEAVKREAEHRRVALAVVGERRLHAARILVIVIHAVLLRVAAARVEPDLGIALDGVHPAGLERVEEDHAVERHPDRAHRHPRDRGCPLRLERQAEVKILDADPVRIVAIGEDRRGVVGIALAVDEECLVVVADRQVGNAVVVRVGQVIAEEVDVGVGVLEDISWRLALANVPASADRLEAGGRIEHGGRRRLRGRFLRGGSSAKTGARHADDDEQRL